MFASKEKLFEDMLRLLVKTYEVIHTRLRGDGNEGDNYPVKFVQIFLLLLGYFPVKTISFIVSINAPLIIAHLFNNLESIYAVKYMSVSYNRKILIHGIAGLLVANHNLCSLTGADALRFFKIAVNSLDDKYLPVIAAVNRSLEEPPR